MNRRLCRLSLSCVHVFIAVQCTVKTHGGQGVCKNRKRLCAGSKCKLVNCRTSQLRRKVTRETRTSNRARTPDLRSNAEFQPRELQNWSRSFISRRPVCPSSVRPLSIRTGSHALKSTDPLCVHLEGYIRPTSQFSHNPSLLLTFHFNTT